MNRDLRHAFARSWPNPAVIQGIYVIYIYTHHIYTNIQCPSLLSLAAGFPGWRCLVSAFVWRGRISKSSGPCCEGSEARSNRCRGVGRLAGEASGAEKPALQGGKVDQADRLLPLPDIKICFVSSWCGGGGGGGQIADFREMWGEYRRRGSA